MYGVMHVILHAVYVTLSIIYLQIIPPGGNTSFDVVFLARVVGNVENTLFINTSHHGVFTYQVHFVCLKMLFCIWCTAINTLIFWTEDVTIV